MIFLVNKNRTADYHRHIFCPPTSLKMPFSSIKVLLIRRKNTLFSEDEPRLSTGRNLPFRERTQTNLSAAQSIASINASQDEEEDTDGKVLSKKRKSVQACLRSLWTKASPAKDLRGPSTTDWNSAITQTIHMHVNKLRKLFIIFKTMQAIRVYLSFHNIRVM